MSQLLRNLEPYLRDTDFTLFQGEALETLKQLPAGSVHCVVTSPPYWGLRDYGTASWGPAICEFDGREMEVSDDGGWICRSTMEHPSDRAWHIPPHDHEGDERWYTEKTAAATAKDAFSEPGESNAARLKKGRWREKGKCVTCGAVHVDQALGLEATPELYVERMVEVFREVRRVLRSDGVCWVNLGDSYAGGNQGGTWDKLGQQTKWERKYQPAGWTKRQKRTDVDAKAAGLKPKDLVGIPWRVAFALQSDGWYLRSDVVWSKPNPMPESVTDRPTKSHEYVFLLTKSPRYFFDQEAVREPGQDWSSGGPGTGIQTIEHYGAGNGGNSGLGAIAERYKNGAQPAGRNVRSVWEIATQPYPEAHFATYPEELVRRCILAGTSERGCCPECGAPLTREVERVDTGERQKKGDGWDTGPGGHGTVHRNGREKGESGIPVLAAQTIGWRPSCDCASRFTESISPVSCTVLDPFGGSGTTALVARKHGRRSILIELSPEYCGLAARRLQQLSLLSEVVEPSPVLAPHKGLTGGAYSPPGQSPHSNARDREVSGG